MKFEIVAESVLGLRWITTEHAQTLYDLITENHIDNVLELGFYHGVSSIYMAAALQENNARGSVTTIDKATSKSLSPNIETLTKELGLEQYVHPIYTDGCYTWELLKLLEKNPRPAFDMIFIDGAHLWKTDALAFFLCDKMLKEGGIIVFDDLKWTMSQHADHQDNDWTFKYSMDERETAHIQKIFNLLVKEHACYGEFREENGFGFARKRRADQINLPKESIIIKPVVVTKEMMQKVMNLKG